MLGPIYFPTISGPFFHLLPTKTCSCQLCWHLQQRGNEFPCEANSSRMNWMKAELIIAHYWKHFWFKKKKKKRGDIFIHISSWKLLGKMLLKSHHLQACNYQILEQKTHGQRTSKNTFIEIKNWGTAIVWNGSRTAGNGNSHNTLSDFTCLWSYQTDLKIQRLINLAAENIKLG